MYGLWITTVIEVVENFVHKRYTKENYLYRNKQTTYLFE